MELTGALFVSMVRYQVKVDLLVLTRLSYMVVKDIQVLKICVFNVMMDIIFQTINVN